MAKSYPETIPAEYTAPELIDAYRRGWNHGHGIACHNVPELGKEYLTDRSGRAVADAENIREIHEDLCFEAADNSRSYSPFEFTAKEFNDAGEGGFRICYNHADRSEEIYSTREEAEEAAKTEGWGGTEIQECCSADELWRAFEEGTSSAIFADLAEYDDDDYGIEADDDDYDIENDA